MTTVGQDEEQEIISLRLKQDRSGWRDFVALLVKIDER
jgi:hypothetical protein